MFESAFEFLFKYRLLVFQEGDFTLRATWTVYIVATLAAAAVAVLTLQTYARARGRSRRVDRSVLAGLRLAALVVLLFCLFRPVLVLTSVVPQQNFLGILIDDSRSMEIADRDGETRSAFVREQFGAPESSLLTALADRFALRFFRFSSSTQRLESVDDLSFVGTKTHLGQALERAHEELAGVPLSGLVVVTDGADNSQATLAESLLPLQAAGVPVFTVGLGREEFTQDIQLSRVETPARSSRARRWSSTWSWSRRDIGARPCRSTSKTRDGSSAPRRWCFPATASRRRCGCASPRLSLARAFSAFGFRRSRARWSPRITSGKP